MQAPSIRWPGTFKEAKRLQALLSKKIRIEPLKNPPSFIAGADCAFFKDRIIAAASLFTFPGIKHVEDVYAVRKNRFPYIPGLLSFREGPAIVSAIRKLKKRPDVVIFDGQGIAHPRGLGIASHIGVILDVPSIGCAKTRLIGTFKEPGRERGDFSPLIYYGSWGRKKVGCVVRTRENVKPLFISPGHRMDLKGSVDIILGCSKGFRLPEPVRRADMFAGRIKKCLED